MIEAFAKGMQYWILLMISLIVIYWAVVVVSKWRKITFTSYLSRFQTKTTAERNMLKQPRITYTHKLKLIL